MRRDSRARLSDVLDAAEAIDSFTRGMERETYEADRLVRSAVMYELMVIGEALNLLSRDDPDLAARIPQVGEAVGMRNVLIHGYEIVDSELVWQTVHEDLPDLVAAVQATLAQAPPATSDVPDE